MTNQLTALVKQAEAGDREAALALWQEARKAGEVELAFVAARLLDHQEETYQWLIETIVRKKYQLAEEIGRALGYELSQAALQTLEEQRKRANGRRLGILANQTSMLEIVTKSMQQPDQPIFQSTYLKPSGRSLIVAGHVENNDIYEDALCVRILNYGTRQRSEDTYRGQFSRWEQWSPTERKDAFLSWLETQEGVVFFPRCEATSHVDAATPALTTGEDILSDEENHFLAQALKIVEGNPNDIYAWWDLHTLINSAPQLATELVVTLLNRALEGLPWEDSYRNYYFDDSKLKAEAVRPWSRLCRCFSRQAEPTESERETHRQRLQSGILTNAKQLILSCTEPDELLCILDQSPSLGNLRSVELSQSQPLPSYDWSRLTKHPVWQQLTALRFMALPSVYSNDPIPRITTPKQSSAESNDLLVEILQSTSHLQELWIKGLRIDESLARAINAQAQLLRLHLLWCDYEESADNEWEQRFPPQLEALSLEDTHVPKGLFTGQTDAPTLRHLDIEHVVFAPTLAEQAPYHDPAIDECLAQPRLAAVESYQCTTHKPSGIVGLAQHSPSQLAKLTLYRMNSTPIPPEEVAILLDPEALTSLVYLQLNTDLSDSDIADAIGLCEQILSAPHLKGLKELAFDVGHTLPNEAHVDLAHSMDFPELETFVVPKCGTFDVALGKAYARCEGLPQLKRLDLRRCGKVYKRALTALEKATHFHRDFEVVLKED